uniref:Uncharacterized protein n=1 Tax=Timema douglasi TaxID=61478 RepID=A0A7R8VN57_TIMDO|nr:unnamed protein product [Timema douglasi]
MWTQPTVTPSVPAHVRINMGAEDPQLPNCPLCDIVQSLYLTDPASMPPRALTLQDAMKDFRRIIFYGLSTFLERGDIRGRSLGETRQRRCIGSAMDSLEQLPKNETIRLRKRHVGEHIAQGHKQVRNKTLNFAWVSLRSFCQLESFITGLRLCRCWVMIGLTAAILVVKDSSCEKERDLFNLEVECLESKNHVGENHPQYTQPGLNRDIFESLVQHESSVRDHVTTEAEVSCELSVSTKEAMELL